MAKEARTKQTDKLSEVGASPGPIKGQTGAACQFRTILDQARAKQEPNDQEIETAQGPGKPKQGTGATREPSKSATGAAQGPSNANQNEARAQQQGPNEQQGEEKTHWMSY